MLVHNDRAPLACDSGVLEHLRIRPNPGSQHDHIRRNPGPVIEPERHMLAALQHDDLRRLIQPPRSRRATHPAGHATDDHDPGHRRAPEARS